MTRNDIYNDVKKAYTKLGLNDESKYRFFTVDDFLTIGQKLAEARLTAKRGPRQHYKDLLYCGVKFIPQTKAQFNYMASQTRGTEWVELSGDVDKVLQICPELSGWVAPTKSGKFSKIVITWYKDFVTLNYSDMELYLKYRAKFY